jgi:hypothetical protein
VADWLFLRVVFERFGCHIWAALRASKLNKNIPYVLLSDAERARRAFMTSLWPVTGKGREYKSEYSNRVAVDIVNL